MPKALFFNGPGHEHVAPSLGALPENMAVHSWAPQSEERGPAMSRRHAAIMPSITVSAAGGTLDRPV